MVENNFNKLLFHPSFKSTIQEIEKLNIRLPEHPVEQTVDFDAFKFPPTGNSIIQIEENSKFKMDSNLGSNEINKYKSICAYDESIDKFESLEGTAFITSHSIVLLGEKDFIPSNLLSFNFYTKAKILLDNTSYIKYSDDPELSSKRDYIEDRQKFLLNNIPNKSLLLIDGPLVGGQMTSYTLKLTKQLLKKEIIPIFFVKNSSGNLVTTYTPTLKDKYNSDMHWSYKFLKEGERTCLYKYQDTHNKTIAKIFCYLKPFNISPQRIEFDLDTFQFIKKDINNLFNLIYYFLIVQGDLKNPQVRPIAIAEKFARATIKTIETQKMMRNIGLVPTMNEERFG